MSFLGLLNKTASIERAASAISDEGYVTETWSEIATNVPCSVQKISGAIRQEDFAEVHEADFIAYFSFGTDIKPKTSGKADRVKIDNEYYLVMDVNDRAGRGRFLKALLKKM